MAVSPHHNPNPNQIFLGLTLFKFFCPPRKRASISCSSLIGFFLPLNQEVHEGRRLPVNQDYWWGTDLWKQKHHLWTRSTATARGTTSYLLALQGSVWWKLPFHQKTLWALEHPAEHVCTIYHIIKVNRNLSEGTWTERKLCITSYYFYW